MTAKISGLYWHVYPSRANPAEWCFNVGERVLYIQTQTPEAERANRLRVMQPVRDVAPALAVAGATLSKAAASLTTAWAALDTAWEAYAQKRATFDTAGANYSTACAAYNKAEAAVLPELIALHAVQCPGCLWTPKHPSIFAGEVT